MGGAMDLVGSGRSRVVVLMEHATKVWFYEENFIFCLILFRNSSNYRMEIIKY